MRKIYPVLVVVLLIVMACSRDRKNAYSDSEKIYKEAIKMHDEVMPMMGSIMDLQAKLKSLKKESDNTGLKDTINIYLLRLENTHKSMMNWMHNLTPIPNPDEAANDPTQLPTREEMLKIQEQSLNDIKRIQQETLESINQTKKFLTNHQ